MKHLLLFFTFFQAALSCLNADDWVVIEASELPSPSEVDYPNCITHLTIKNVKTGEESRVAGFGIRDRNLTDVGQLNVKDRFSPQFLSTAPASSEKEMRVDDTTRFDLPTKWIQSTVSPDSETPQSSEFEEARQQRYALDRRSIRNTLMSQIGPVTGGVTNEYFFYGDRKFYKDDFWKTSRVENGGIREVIRQFHAYLSSRGIRLIVVPIPSTSTIYPDHATNLYYKPEKHGPVNTPILELCDTLRAEDHIDVLDVVTPLLEKRYFDYHGENYPIFRPNDTHWSPFGAKVVAQLCAEAIGDVPLTTPFSEEVRVEQLKSDIEDILSSKHPYRSQEVLPHRSPLFMVKPDNAEAEQWLDKSREFPDTRIHLIGDSFVDVLSEKFADIHSHLVRLTGEPIFRLERYGGGGTIPQAWLDTVGHQQSTPEIVVFLFGERYAAVDEIWQPLKLPE